MHQKHLTHFKKKYFITDQSFMLCQGWLLFWDVFFSQKLDYDFKISFFFQKQKKHLNQVTVAELHDDNSPSQRAEMSKTLELWWEAL